MKDSEMKATFIIDRRLWGLFLTMAKETKVTKGDKKVQARGSDVLRELIEEWVETHSYLWNKIMEAMTEVVPNAIVTSKGSDGKIRYFKAKETIEALEDE